MRLQGALLHYLNTGDSFAILYPSKERSFLLKRKVLLHIHAMSGGSASAV
jgi:hypothetical protein